MKKKFGFIFQNNSQNAQDFVGRDRIAVSTSYTRSYGFVPDYGRGVEIWDVDGQKYLDLAAGIAVLSTGYSHPHVISEVKDQIDNLVHIGGTDFFPTNQIKLAEKLQEIIPIHNTERPADKRVHIVNSGSEANETALKLARYRRSGREGRSIVLAFYGAFHGRTYGSLSLTASKAIQRSNFSHIPGGVIHLPYPSKFVYDNAPGDLQQSIEFDTVAFIKKYIFKKVSPDQIAAVFVEPIQGEGGYVVPVDHFLPDLREFCNQYGILLVVDEIQSGIGRTGKWIATEHWDVKPDIVTLAKGLGSGFQIGAVVASQQVMNWLPGTHASTYSGHSVSCRAALATLDVIEEERLMENVNTVSAFAIDELKQLQQEFPDIIHRIDGKGLMIGIEFAEPDGNPLPRFRDRVVENCFLKHVLTLGAGKSTLRLAPPLIITIEQMREGLTVLREAIVSALNEPDHIEQSSMIGPDVLIVEDEALIRRSVAATIEKVLPQVNILEAENFDRAKALLETTSNLLLIILDNSLTDDKTDSKGIELLPYIEPHVNQNDTVVIAFTSTMEIADFRQFVLHGVLTDIIEKGSPDNYRQLQQAIETSLKKTLIV